MAAKTTLTTDERKISILKALKKSSATSVTKGISLKKLYEKVGYDPFVVRRDVRDLVEGGFVKKSEIPEEGISVSRTSKIHPSEKSPTPKTSKKPQDPASAEFSRQEEGR